MVLSPWGSLSSSAITTQFAKMVMTIVDSKTGQLMNQVASLLRGLEGVNRKSEVGPW